jgi:hypothetical protein
MTQHPIVKAFDADGGAAICCAPAGARPAAPRQRESIS